VERKTGLGGSVESKEEIGHMQQCVGAPEQFTSFCFGPHHHHHLIIRQFVSVTSTTLLFNHVSIHYFFHAFTPTSFFIQIKTLFKRSNKNVTILLPLRNWVCLFVLWNTRKLKASVNRPPTPDVVENAPEREPTLQELINIKVSSFYLFGVFQVSIAGFLLKWLLWVLKG